MATVYSTQFWVLVKLGIEVIIIIFLFLTDPNDSLLFNIIIIIF